MLSLAPIPLLLFGIPASIVWLIACLSLGFFLAGISIWATRLGRLTRFPRLFWPLVSLSWGFTILQFLGVAALFGLPRPAVFAAGLWWLIVGAAIQFFTQAVAASRS